MMEPTAVHAAPLQTLSPQGQFGNNCGKKRKPGEVKNQFHERDTESMTFNMETHTHTHTDYKPASQIHSIYIGTAMDIQNN